MAHELQDNRPAQAGRSYAPGIVFLVAAGVAKAIGVAMSGSVAESARSSRGWEAMDKYSSAAYIEGTTEVAVMILGLTGIVLLIRAAMSRVKRKTPKV